MAAFVGWLVAVSGIHFPGLCSFSEGVSFEDLSKLAPLEQWSAVRRTSNPRRRLLSLGTAPGRAATGPTSGAPELAQRAGAPLAAQLPALGKAQILLAIGIIEHQSEWKIKPHYMKVRRTPPLRRTPWLAARAARCSSVARTSTASPPSLPVPQGGVPGSLKGLKSFWDPVGFTSKLDAAKLERQRLCEIKNGCADPPALLALWPARGTRCRAGPGLPAHCRGPQGLSVAPPSRWSGTRAPSQCPRPRPHAPQPLRLPLWQSRRDAGHHLGADRQLHPGLHPAADHFPGCVSDRSALLDEDLGWYIQTKLVQRGEGLRRPPPGLAHAFYSKCQSGL